MLEGNKLLPVMVWIHGGAFIGGSANRYHMDYFMDQDVVVVSINYRLGSFGFLSTADGAIRGNMGLKDQAIALKWVRENIKDFEGDPNKVKIFGESAGGASVHYQGLFDKAIAQSGGPGAPWALYSPEEVKKVTFKFAKSVGCHSEESLQVLKCLKGLEELLEGVVYDVANLYIHSPDRDGQHMRPCIETIDDSEAFLTEHPLDIINSGKAQRVPLIAGVNSGEGLMMSAGTLDFTNPTGVDFLNEFCDFVASIVQATGQVEGIRSRDTKNIMRQAAPLIDSKDDEEIAQSLKQFYLPKFNELSNDERCDAYTKLFTDLNFNLPVNYLLTKQREYSPVYPYVYNRRGGPSFFALFAISSSMLPPSVASDDASVKSVWSKLPIPKGRDYGVCHGDVLPMLFFLHRAIAVPKDDRDPNYLFSKDFVKLLTDFAKDEEYLELNGLKFEPAPKSGPLQYFHLSEKPSIAIPEFLQRTEFLQSLGFLRQKVVMKHAHSGSIRHKSHKSYL